MPIVNEYPNEKINGQFRKVLVDGDDVYLKKSLGYWGVVYPLKKDDGSWNWFNIITGGDLTKFFFMILMFILLLLAINEYSSNIKYCQSLINNMTFFR